MSEMIDHAAVASALIPEYPLRGSFDAARDALAMAQVHAVLALVEQQRIANLIALAQGTGSSMDEALPLLYDEAAFALVGFERTPATPIGGPDEYPMVRPWVAEALGLA